MSIQLHCRTTIVFFIEVLIFDLAAESALLEKQPDHFYSHGKAQHDGWQANTHLFWKYPADATPMFDVWEGERE